MTSSLFFKSLTLLCFNDLTDGLENEFFVYLITDKLIGLITQLAVMAIEELVCILLPFYE